MMILLMIVLVFAFVLLVLAGTVPESSQPPRFRFLGIGLACFVLAYLIERSGLLQK